MDLESQLESLSATVELLHKSVSCSICLEIMTNPTRTSCGHLFCHFCIMMVINTNRMAHCPLCNSKISRRSVKEDVKAKGMVETVLNLINSIGKDLGKDIVAHAKVSKSTQEALLTSPKVQRFLRQPKPQPKTLWQKPDCKNKSDKQVSKNQEQKKYPEALHIGQETPAISSEKEGAKEQEQASQELISISQVPSLSPPTTHKNISDSTRRNSGVFEKKKVEEWLNQTCHTVTSNVRSVETEVKNNSEQMTVVADVHQAEGEDLNSAVQQRVRYYKISKRSALVFTDANKITVDNQDDGNKNKRNVENRNENEIETVDNSKSDPYIFISSQKTSTEPARRSSRSKNNENISLPSTSKVEIQKEKTKMSEEMPPEAYSESQSLNVDLNDTFDKLVMTAKKIVPCAAEEEQSDSDDTVYLYRTPLEGTLKQPSDTDVHLGSLEGMPGKKSNSKAKCRKRSRSKCAETSKPAAKTKPESQNIKQMIEGPKANLTAPLSPSKKINEATDDAVKNNPSFKRLILDKTAKEKVHMLEKENLSDVIQPATSVNISKLNSTLGTKSPGWSRISKSKKEFDKLKRQECAALNISGGTATKRKKITDSFTRVSSDTVVIPPVEDTQGKLDTPVSTIKDVTDDTPETEKLNSVEVIGGQPPKAFGKSNFLKPEVSVSEQNSSIAAFSNVSTLDSPATRKRRIHVESIIDFLNENEAGKVSETTSFKDPERPDMTTHDPNEAELEDHTEQLQKKNAGNTQPEKEIVANYQQAPSENTVSDKDEAKKTSLIPTSEVAKVDRLSYNVETRVQTCKHLDSCISSNAEELRVKNRKSVTFLKRGRLIYWKRSYPFMLLGKLEERKEKAMTAVKSAVDASVQASPSQIDASVQASPIISRIDDSVQASPSQSDASIQASPSQIDAFVQVSPSQMDAFVQTSPLTSPVQTGPTPMFPSPEKNTLEFLEGNFVAGSSETIDLSSAIPLPGRKSVNVLNKDPTFFSVSQVDNISTQKFCPAPSPKKLEAASKLLKEVQTSDSDIALSQLSEATTIKYDLTENFTGSSNYSPDRSFFSRDRNKDGRVSQERISVDFLSENSNDIKVPSKRKSVNRWLDSVPFQLPDPALDESPEAQTNKSNKKFKRIRYCNSLDSEQTSIVNFPDVHGSGGKRVERDTKKEDIEVVDLISSERNSKAGSPGDEPNSAELMARVMANIDADLAVKRKYGSSCHTHEIEMVEDRNTPSMFTSTEGFQNQINSCSADFQPNSAASSEAIIMGTLQQENQFVVKSKAPTGEPRADKVYILPQESSDTNKTSDGDCESDDEIVQRTPDKTLNSRSAVTTCGPSELRSVSSGIYEVLPEGLEKHSQTMLEKPSSVQSHKTDMRSSLPTRRCSDPTAVEKPKPLKQSTQDTAQEKKSGFNGWPAEEHPHIAEAPVQVKPCFVCSGLGAPKIAEVKKLANIVNADFSNTFTPNTTHLIVKHAEDNTAYKTLKYLYAVVRKKWVVSPLWVSDCLQAGRLLPEDNYELLDSSGENGPYRSRNSTVPLLAGFQFCCLEPFTDITKQQLEELLVESGASVVKSPEELNGLYRMILVQDDTVTQEDVQYWLNEFKSITVLHEWALDCIGRHRLMPIWPHLLLENDEHPEIMNYPDEVLVCEELEPES